MLCFFFNAPATTEIYTLSLHDALPIWNWSRSPTSGRRSAGTSSNATGTTSPSSRRPSGRRTRSRESRRSSSRRRLWERGRSEEHTSELQSQFHLVCRLLLEKKKNIIENAVMTIVLLVLVRIFYDRIQTYAFYPYAIAHSL